jgi:hypothetical protein
MGFSDPNNAWATLVDYFYTEEVLLTHENVMPLFAMSRELLIPKIQEYCSDFAQSSLECSNALSYLCQAVQLSCDGFRHTCVRLVAEGFPSSFCKRTDGLPVEVRFAHCTQPNSQIINQPVARKMYFSHGAHMTPFSLQEMWTPTHLALTVGEPALQMKLTYQGCPVADPAYSDSWHLCCGITM